MKLKLQFCSCLCLLILVNFVNCSEYEYVDGSVESVDYENLNFDDDYEEEFTNFKPGDSRKIIGGQNADISQFPYQVSIRINEAHFCGGAIVDSQFIITAGHCVYSLSFPINIYVGSSSFTTNGKSYKVTNISLHPLYDNYYLDYDVAVLEVEPIQLSSRVKPIQVTSKGERVGTMGTISGWGILGEREWRPSSTLQSLQVPVLSEILCKLIYDSYSYTDTMFCAGYMDGQKDACQGDSGGPFVVDNELVGVISWGIGCARRAYPGVYTKLSHPLIRKFIHDVTKL